MKTNALKSLQTSVFLILLVPTLASSGEEKMKPESYAAVVVGTGGAIGASSMNIDIRIDKEGKGAGTIIGAAQVSINQEGALEIESLGNRYAKLVNVRAWD